MARNLTQADEYAAKVAELKQGIGDLGGLVTRAEIARRLGISRQRVTVLSKRSTFPEPIAEDVDGRHVWLWEPVRLWHEQRARTGWLPEGEPDA